MKACPSPSAMNSAWWLSSSRRTASHCANVGEPTRRSTTTSRIAPRTQVTYLACPGGTSAKCTPRTTPQRETEQLACRSARSYPVASRNSSPRYHSWKLPRSSGKTFGSSAQAPVIPSDRKLSRLSGLGRLRCRTPPEDRGERAPHPAGQPPRDRGPGRLDDLDGVRVRAQG